MCDYSLHTVTSRPAKVGDKLVSTEFRNSVTRGFSAVGDPTVAVCLRPGTEIAFEKDGVKYRHSFLPNRMLEQKVARFRQINMGNPNTHHDALEFPNALKFGKTSSPTLRRKSALRPSPTNTNASWGISSFFIIRAFSSEVYPRDQTLAP